MELEMISVIIPVYNTADFLPECLESVLDQDYKNIEIIAVNDGSTDESLSILEKYASLHKNLKIINQTNQGPAAARNAGLNIARGDWISFIDSDDIIDRVMLSSMYNAGKKTNSDIVVCDFSKDVKLNQFDGLNLRSKAVSIENLGIFLNQYFYKEYKSSVCVKLMNHKLINNTIRFIDKQVAPEEDVLFSLKIASKANRVVFIDAPFYHYRARQGSITHTMQTDEYFCDRLINTIDLYKEFLNNKKENYILLPFYAYYFISSLSSGINNTKNISLKKVIRITSRVNKNINAQEYYRLISKKGVQLDGLPSKNKLFYRIISTLFMLQLQLFGCILLYSRAQKIQKKWSKE